MKGKKKKRKNFIKKKLIKKRQARQTKISKDFVNLCKKKLMDKLYELKNLNYKNEMNNAFEIGDEVDLARHDIGKEIFHELSDAQENLLELISSALEKIERMTYGFCEKCGKMIPKKRLEALPWVRYCIKCQTNIDKLRK